MKPNKEVDLSDRAMDYVVARGGQLPRCIRRSNNNAKALRKQRRAAAQLEIIAAKGSPTKTTTAPHLGRSLISRKWAPKGMPTSRKARLRKQREKLAKQIRAQLDAFDAARK